jgi:3-dehydroquinate synthase
MRIHSEYQHKSPTQTFLFKSQLPTKSQINIGYGAYENVGKVLSQLGVGKQVLITTQTSIAGSWLEPLVKHIKDSGYEVHILELADGEHCKSIESLISAWNKLQSHSFTRNDTIIALGGGAISDLVGFAGSTYLRGINTVIIPTTLLAQVDASIGGKTAINLENGKNLAGTFYFPNLIIIDPLFLSTLPEQEFLSGLGEIIKYALIEQTVSKETEYKIGTKPLFSILQDIALSPFSKESPFLLNIISCCVKMKLAVVGKDPYEKNLRRCLNLGHTLGHGIEKASQFEISHGEAVSIGLNFALSLAESIGKLNKDDVSNAIALIKGMNLPIDIPNNLNKEKIMQAVLHDKKRENNTIKFVLPEEKLGIVSIDYQIPVNKFREFLTRQ